MRTYFLPIILALIALGACTSRHKNANLKPQTSNVNRLPGDRSVYGLACDGCTDSVLVLLPEDGSDPVKYDIIDAMHAHQVMGRPKVGDWVAVVPNAKDSLTADFVVDIDELKGVWCYLVEPTLRDRGQMNERARRRIEADMPDSLREALFVPREYGFALKRNWEARSIGYVPQVDPLEDESPVEYPPLGYFTEWHLWNGKLVITSGQPQTSQDGVSVVADQRQDTCDIVLLMKDSLVLSSEGQTRGYYRRQSISEENKDSTSVDSTQAKKP